MPHALTGTPPATACEHGGAVWSILGDRFERLERASSIVAADVLDAWFPPAPAVIDALRAHLGFLIRTSPPTPSDDWLSPSSRVLLLDPSYGEYRHLAEHVLGARVDTLALARARLYDVDLAELADGSGVATTSSCSSTRTARPAVMFPAPISSACSSCCPTERWPGSTKPMSITSTLASRLSVAPAGVRT